MMKIRIIAEGKIKSKPVRELASDYASRILHYFPIDCIDAKDEDAALKLVEKEDVLVVCDERGQQRTSVDMANFIANQQRRKAKRLVFYIGGPEGVGAKMKERADELLALSRMTFPHEMARAVLLEQIYRACTILKGEKYHK